MVEVNYDTTRCGGGGRADIDATEDTLLKVYRFYKRQGRETFDSYTNERQAKDVRKGDTVLVIRGRKIPKGSVGEVFWIGTRYNRFSRMTEDRVGVEIYGVRQFLPLEYVEPVNWQERLLHGKERKRLIRNFAINSMPSSMSSSVERTGSSSRGICGLISKTLLLGSSDRREEENVWIWPLFVHGLHEAGVCKD